MAHRLSRPRPVAWQLFASQILLASGAFTGSAFAAEEAPSVPGQILVRFKPDVTKATIDGLNQFMGGNASPITPADPQLYVIDLPQGMDNASGLKIYNGLTSVEYAELSFIYLPVAIPNDPRFSQQWALSKISAPAAWDITTGNPAIVLADTDTGADYNHEDLGPCSPATGCDIGANIWVNQGEICGNGIDDDANGFTDDCIGWNFFNGNNDPLDTNGHGSNTTGIMGAIGNNGIGVAGVMWNAQIMVLKMGNGSFAPPAIIAAIDYASRMGARVINASWGGGGFSTSIRSAIQRAADAGVLFVAAAGNNGTNNDVSPFYPASYDLPNIIAVANTGLFDTLHTGFEPSNWGPNSVHLAAPGTNILSTYPGNQYVSYVGTSQAAPHVAGVAGLILSVNPNLSYSDVKNIILSSVDPIASLQDRVITGGRLNANAALQMTPPPP